MAILSKIRERSLALIAVIGLALFAFVLDPSQLSDFFNSSKVNAIGEVNGETITRQEFAEAIKIAETEKYAHVTYFFNGTKEDTYPGEVRKLIKSKVVSHYEKSPEMQAAKVVWDNLLRQKIYGAQLESAGIVLSDEDAWFELVNSPAAQQNPQFKNQAGLFDEEKLKLFLADAKEKNNMRYMH